MSKLLEALAVTAEMTNTEWSKAAVKVIEGDLSAYPVDAVLESLARCRRELKGRLTLADILDRMPGLHPKPEEAWALASRCLDNEWESIVWTDEMRQAFGVAQALDRDRVAARLAFKEAYQELVGKARAANQSPRWSVSLGYDPAGRELALTEAVRLNRISAEYAAALLPPREVISSDALALASDVSVAMPTIWKSGAR